MVKEQISNFKQIEEIILKEGGVSNGIKIKFDSKIPLFFHYNELPSSLTIEKGEYNSAINYVKKILDEHADYYNAKSIIKGVCECSGKERHKYKIRLEQILEIAGASEKQRSKMLNVSISFQTGSGYSFFGLF
jgi:hypothetical protein